VSFVLWLTSLEAEIAIYEDKIGNDVIKASCN